MIYLDNGATSFRKPRQVKAAVLDAMERCANPGRGGYPASLEASRRVYTCREEASKLFHCRPEQVVFTGSCTQGLNTAIRSMVKPGDPVAVSGFEHNAVTRPLTALGAEIQITGRKLFDREDTLNGFRRALDSGIRAVVVTHVSNVFGYILPVPEIAALCRERGVPLIVDAAQSAGVLDVDMEGWGADFIAMPGHKGLLGPQGTGLLLCKGEGTPLVYGGTGSQSRSQEMPDFLPDRLEAGTLNVPGIAGLGVGLRYLNRMGTDSVFRREHRQLRRCAEGLKSLGMKVFSGPHQAGTLSFLSGMDCEEGAELLAKQGIAVRAGLHCAPFAHESAGTLESGTIRVSFGHDAADWQTERFLRAASKLTPCKD